MYGVRFQCLCISRMMSRVMCCSCSSRGVVEWFLLILVFRVRACLVELGGLVCPGSVFCIARVRSLFFCGGIVLAMCFRFFFLCSVIMHFFGCARSRIQYSRRVL